MFEAVVEDALRKQRENYQKGVEEGEMKGKREAKRKIIEKMLKNKMNDDTIIMMTSTTKEELEEIKQKLKL